MRHGQPAQGDRPLRVLVLLLVIAIITISMLNMITIISSVSSSSIIIIIMVNDSIIIVVTAIMCVVMFAIISRHKEIALSVWNASNTRDTTVRFKIGERLREVCYYYY